ncbi:hypothetical protein BWI17_15270 [Betaproteobacteria bacterium GR16-43]|nr:hypothetical protein BWI17_15270 [Betaproteobacteria bacterium GR16-43]
MAEPGVRAEVGNIETIEGLRGVAVLYVIAFHYWVLRLDKFGDPLLHLIAGTPLQRFVAHGFLGVDLFFVLTGFLLTLPWFRHDFLGLERPSAREFYKRRARRIVPAYYVQLVVLFAIVVPLVLGRDFWMRNLYFLAANIPAHFTFLHYTTPVSSASLGLNGALWTLALEAQYYLLVPLLAPFFVRGPWRSAFVLVAIAAAWRWLADHDLAPLVAFEMRMGAPWNLPESVIRHLLTTQLPGYLAHFAVGIVIGRAWLLLRSRPVSARLQAYWAGTGLLAIYLVVVAHSTEGGLFGEMSWAVVPLCFGIALFALVVGAPSVGHALLANRPLQFTGRVSYSAYLYHLPLLLLWNKYAPGLGWASAPCYLAVVLGVSWLSFRWVEQPFMKSRREKAWPKNAARGASEAPSTSPITTASGASPSTTTVSSSNS